MEETRCSPLRHMLAGYRLRGQRAFLARVIRPTEGAASVAYSDFTNTERMFWYGGLMAAAKTMTSPLERIRILRQTEPELVRNGTLNVPYDGKVAAVGRRVMVTEGFAGLFRGNSCNMVCLPITLLGSIAVRQSSMAITRDVLGSDASVFQAFVLNSALGAMGGLGLAALTYPLDYARTRMACDVLWRQTHSPRPRQFPTFVHALEHGVNVRPGGFSNLYTGFSLFATAAAANMALTHATYQLAKTVSGRDPSEAGGALSSLIASYGTLMLLHPLDTVRQRLMVTVGASHTWASGLECARHIWETEGRISLWRGAGVNVVRAVACSAMFILADVSRKALFRIWYPAMPEGKEEEFQPYLESVHHTQFSQSQDPRWERGVAQRRAELQQQQEEQLRQQQQPEYE